MSLTAAAIQDIEAGIAGGDRRMLAKGITLVESHRKQDTGAAQHILEKVMNQTGRSVRVGITGVPGVGKSTFIETLGMQLIGHGHRIAVLAVDPSSPRSGGSILGDKTRMPALSMRPEAFIRPSPAGGIHGGVAGKTRETMLLCEAAGYDVILVETVGVGQAEVEVASMVDFFMVLLLPGAGDALQGIKKGIIELADMLVINKADGDNLPAARLAKREYEQALHLLRTGTDCIELCSSVTGDGISRVWDEVNEYIGKGKQTGHFETKRRDQLYGWMTRMTEEAVLQDFREDDRMRNALAAFRSQLEKGETTPVIARNKLLNLYRKISADRI
ncbi:MAG: methylmalonyl Co-A mutase-associated GTPase MeaB [Balneolales bacterium]